MSVVSEYFNYLEKYQKIYSENVVVLYQLGSFFEIYGVQNDKETLGNVQEIAQLLNIQLTRKNKSVVENNRKNALMVGFPCCSLEKYIPVLINNNYTVVIVEQYNEDNKIKRKVSKILSSGTVFNNESDFNYITCILVEQVKNTFFVGISSIDISLGNVYLYEVSGEKQYIIDKISFFLKSHNTSEVIINTELPKDFIINSLEIENIIVHWCSPFLKEFKQNNYQNEFLSKIYKNESLLTPIEFLDIEKLTISISTFINLLNFIYQGNESTLTNLKHPIIYNCDDFLVLLNDAHSQLNIFSNTKSKGKYKSVFDVINKTKTIIGKRKLKNDLLFPIKNANKLITRYDIIDKLLALPDTKIVDIRKNLSKIYDIEKYTRKLALNTLQPCDWNGIITSLHGLLDIYKITQIIYIDTNLINQFLEYYNKIFDFNELSKYNNINEIKTGIKKGINKDLDELDKSYNELYNSLEKIADSLSELINGKNIVKIVFNEQFYLTTTNIRASAIKNKTDKFSFISNKSGTKIANNEINKISNKLISIEIELKHTIQKSYNLILQETFTNYQDFFKEITNTIGIIDTYVNQALISKTFCYTRPEIVETNHLDSFIDVKDIRHPLIERINDNVEYIANDVYLGKESIILFGLNSSGKSSLLKSIGIAVILAQSGFYVPCSSMTLNPFSTLIPRINSGDNILKNQSSFYVEMLELKMILKNANKSTLVLLDELASSSESVSANSIVASAILFLNKNNCPFMLATHLHFLSKFEKIKDNINIKMKHTSVSFDKEIIIYNRKLKEGNGGDLYGLEVAKNIGLNPEFLKVAFEIRNELIGKSKLLLNTKVSSYNKDKLINSCEICNYRPIKKTDLPLDVHHILFQCTSDNNGIISGKFHKNEKFNLVVLCKECHIKTHKNEIKINGYIQTSSGIKLDFIVK